MNGWGGRREGSGRKLGSRNAIHIRRKHRGIVAFDDEWELIKRYANLVKHVDKEKAKQLLESVE